MVTLGVIPSLHLILAAGLVESTWLLLPEQLGVFSPEAAKVLVEALDGYTALLVGPGLTEKKRRCSSFTAGLMSASDENQP